MFTIPLVFTFYDLATILCWIKISYEVFIVKTKLWFCNLEYAENVASINYK
jgi:hypothetical protein